MRHAARILALALFGLWACSSDTLAHLGFDFPRDPTVDASAGAGAPEDASMPPPAAGAPAAAPECSDPTADCDGDAATGCETNLLRDRTNCGRCGTRCPSADCACRDGKLVADCKPGYADCDNDLINGCEAQIESDQSHCGGCGRVCVSDGEDVASAVCTAGRCVLTCSSRQRADCDGDASNGCESSLWFDPQNCGGCGVRCACEFGVCSSESI